MASLLSPRSGHDQLKEYLQQLCALQFDKFDKDSLELPEASDAINKFLREPSSRIICVSQLYADHNGVHTANSPDFLQFRTRCLALLHTDQKSSLLWR